MKEKAVALDDIILDERCQPRAILNNEAVQEYAELYKEGEVSLPALEVVDVDGALLLINGFHRLAGARQADHGFIRVEVVEEADIDRAIWLAAAANQGFGVRRTSDDKRRAVRMALQNEIGIEQSSAHIAEHVGVSRDLVSRIRDEVEADQSGRVKGRDGKSYPKRTKSQDVESTPCEPGTDQVVDDESTDSGGVQSERKPKKAKPNPFEAFRKNVQHVGRDVPKFYEHGSEVHEAAQRFVRLVREHEPDVAEVM